MPTLAVWLLGLVQPLVARVLLALGLAVTTYTGFDLLFTQIAQQTGTAWGGLPPGVRALAGLAGFGEALSILFGAFATRVAILQAVSFTRKLSAAPSS